MCKYCDLEHDNTSSSAQPSHQHSKAPSQDPPQRPPANPPEPEQQPCARDQANQLHKRIQQAVRIERRAIREIALGLTEMERTRLYRELGYAGLVEYGEQAFGFRSSKTRQLALVGRRLPTLPALDQALCCGALGWTKARTVAQIATPETEQAWVERALQVTSRELEDLVADARDGAPPPDADEAWEPPRYMWAKFRLDLYHFERLMQALTLVRHQLGDPDMSSSQLLLYMAERCLDGDLDQSAEEGGELPPPTHVCSEEPATEEERESPTPAVDMCQREPLVSDGQDASAPAVLARREESPADEGREEPAERAHVCQQERQEVIMSQQAPRPIPAGENAFPINCRIIEHRCPSCDRAWMEGQTGRIELDERTRALVECDAEVVAGDESAGKPGHLNRTIPPATRRAVLIRDKGRCQVPGCRNKKHLELHHIDPWATSRNHQPENLTTLCSCHHDLVHRDVLRVSRDPDGALRCERGGGEPLGILVSFWGERDELDHGSLPQFEGPPGSWPIIQGYWPGMEPPEGLIQLPPGPATKEQAPGADESDSGAHVCARSAEASTIKERYPRGRQLFRVGDEARMADPWTARSVRV